MAKELLNVCEFFPSFICYSFVSPFYLRVGLHSRSTLDCAFALPAHERICRHQPTLSTNHLDIKYFVCCVEYKSIA